MKQTLPSPPAWHIILRTNTNRALLCYVDFNREWKRMWINNLMSFGQLNQFPKLTKKFLPMKLSKKIFPKKDYVKSLTLCPLDSIGTRSIWMIQLSWRNSMSCSTKITLRMMTTCFASITLQSFCVGPSCLQDTWKSGIQVYASQSPPSWWVLSQLFQPRSG